MALETLSILRYFIDHDPTMALAHTVTLSFSDYLCLVSCMLPSTGAKNIP